MVIGNWTFKEDPWWDTAHSAVAFVAEAEGRRELCAISQVALNDYFQTEDTKAAALANYNAHCERVHRLAARLLEEGLSSGGCMLIITSGLCQRYGL